MQRNGFSNVSIGVAVVVMIVIGSGGYLFFSQKKVLSLKEAEPSQTPIISQKPVEPSAPLKEGIEKQSQIKISPPIKKATVSEQSPLSVKWQQLRSPPGGGYWTIAIAPSDPKSIFVASGDFGVVKTNDGGKTWKNIGEKIFGAHIFSNIAVHLSDPNTFFVSNGTLHYTNDGGTVWDQASFKKTNIGQDSDRWVTAIAYNTKNPRIMYAGDKNNFYISSDGGKNWSLAGSVSIEGDILSIVEGDDSDLYVMMNDSGVFKSIDEGKTWMKKNNGIAAFSYAGGMFNHRYLVYDKLSSKFYLATENGLYVSSDINQWQLKGPFQNENLPLTVATADAIIYVTTESGKLYKSNNGGESWEVVYTAKNLKRHHNFPYAVSIHNTQPDIVYVATDREILKSRDGGKSWQEISKEIYDDALFVMDYASDTKTLWVGAYWTRGLFTTTDEGRTWRFVESWRHTEPSDHYPMSLDINPLNGKEVYVSGAKGVKKTTDNGETWTALEDDILVSGKHIHGMLLDPARPSTIYAGSAPGWDQGLQVSQVFKSIDGGNTWKKLPGFPSREENNIYAFAVGGDTIYAALTQHESSEVDDHDNSLGMWKSLDAGATWQDISANLPNKNVYSVSVHPQKSDVVYVGLGHIQPLASEGEHSKGEQGLFQSKDGGKSWQRIEGLPELQPSKIRFHPKNPNIILVSFGEHICGACNYRYPQGAGVWGSADGGEKWYNLIPEGIFTKRQLAVMDIVFKDEGTMYAVTDDGVFKGELNIHSN